MTAASRADAHRPWPDGPGVVELPDGSRARGRSRSAPATLDGLAADHSVVLAWRPPPEAPGARWVRWPDFWLPLDRDDALHALAEAHRLARAGARVEVTCAGGRGRTGTALACVAWLAGVPAVDAVAWVRARYHPRAVEMPWQAAWVARLSRAGSGPEPP